MSDVKIFGKTLTGAEVKALAALAAEAGCAVENIKVVESIGEPDAGRGDEIVLILATPATCSQPDLEKEMARAMNGARRVIWVWPENGRAADVPGPTKKYSYSIIPWSAEKLAAVAADDDITCFELPSGQPLPKEKTERNLCVEEIKKPK
jgi:hypothetical protein